MSPSRVPAYVSGFILLQYSTSLLHLILSTWSYTQAYRDLEQSKDALGPTATLMLQQRAMVTHS